MCSGNPGSESGGDRVGPLPLRGLPRSFRASRGPRPHPPQGTVCDLLSEGRGRGLSFTLGLPACPPTPERELDVCTWPSQFCAWRPGSDPIAHRERSWQGSTVSSSLCPAAAQGQCQLQAQVPVAWSSLPLPEHSHGARACELVGRQVGSLSCTLPGGGGLPLGPNHLCSQRAQACSHPALGLLPLRPAVASPLAPASWPIPCSCSCSCIPNPLFPRPLPDPPSQTAPGQDETTPVPGLPSPCPQGQWVTQLQTARYRLFSDHRGQR